MGLHSDPIVTYDIDLGMHLVLCHGAVDELQRIWWGDRVAWEGSAKDEQITVSASRLYNEDGGLSGAIDVMMGGPTQAKNDYLQARLGTNIPAWRGSTSLVFRQTYVGRSKYLPNPAFDVRRTGVLTTGDAQWYPSKANIDGAMNPAHIVRECLTDRVWGLGYPASSIDDTRFTALADTLYTEDFGLSIAWEGSEPIEDFILRIMEHVDGHLYVHPHTGLWSTVLIRGGIDPETLFTVDPSVILEMISFERVGFGDRVNDLTVIYHDRDTDQDTPVRIKDTGAIAVQQRIVSQTKSYPGIDNKDLALRVAQRDLKVLSAGLANARIIVDRQGWEGVPGTPFKLTWPKYGIQDVVFRVANISTGTMEDGRLQVDIVEDYFGLPTGTYVGQEPSAWVPPNTAPIAATYEQTREATYWEVYQYANEGDIPEWGDNFGFAVMHVVRPTGADDALHYEVWSRIGAADWEFQTKGKFCPTATLTSAVGYGSTGLTGVTWNVENIVDFSKVAAGYAYIDNEIIAVSAVDEAAGTVTLDRAVLDSVPAPHSAGSRIWFADKHLGIDDDLHQYGETIDMRALPTTTLGTLDIGDATTRQQGINKRFHRPYPPGNVKLDGDRYPVAITGDLTVTWSHRDRTQQLDAFHAQTETDIGPEAGTAYNLRLYDGSGNLLNDFPGISGTSQTIYLTAGLWTTATWNSADKHANITLSNADLTAAAATTGWKSARATLPHAAKSYFEVTVDVLTNSQMIGFATTSASLSNYLGANAQGWQYASATGELVNNGTFTAFGSTYTQGDVIGVAVDPAAGKAWFAKNGTWQAGGDPATGANPAVTGFSALTVYPGTSIYQSGDQQTVNFGATAFAYTPPTGFEAAGEGYPSDLRLELESERDGLTSTQLHNIAFNLAGYGLGYGTYYGGY